MPASVDAKDLSILHCLTNIVGGMPPAFTEEELFSGFRDVLVLQGLLTEAEAVHLVDVRKAISLSAVAAMHHTSIDLGDGTFAELSAMDDMGDGNLGVMATASVTYPPKGDIYFGGSVYETRYATNECCEPELLDHESKPSWNCPIELTGEGTLRQIG